MERLLDRIDNIENKLPILVRISQNDKCSDNLYKTYMEALLFVSNKLEDLSRSPPSSTLLDVERNIEYRRYLQIKSYLLTAISRFDYSFGNIELY